VKQIIAELTPVLRGRGNYFRTGNADREFNKMDSFVPYQRLRRWHFRRDEQRPTKRPFSGDSAVWNESVSVAGHGEAPCASHTEKIIVAVCRKTARTVGKGKLEAGWRKPAPR
jgi:hypothetical protein